MSKILPLYQAKGYSNSFKIFKMAYFGTGADKAGRNA